MEKISLPAGVVSSMIKGKANKNVEKGETFEIEITPELAKEWLKTNSSNRKFSKHNVDFLVNQIQSGKWKYNGNTIVFDENGNLLDGQHRLEAVVISKKNISSNVTFGIERETFSTIDTGKIRNSSDILSTKGYMKAGVLSSTAKVILSIETGVKGIASGGLKSTKFDNADILKFVETREDFVETTYEAHRIWAKMPSRFIPSKVFCAMYYLFSKKHTNQAKAFMTSLAVGVGMEIDAPVFHLRNRLIKMHNDKNTKHTVFHKCTIIAKAWNLQRTATKVKNLHYKRGEAMQNIK